jgi:DNA-binding PadR family transcriptional regulator
MKYMANRTRPDPAVKRPTRALTTTSYAILGLLAIKPWSAYELTQQMDRSLRFHWPRAQTRVYLEPPNLVAHGLASSQTQHHGRRARTVYAITEEGRRALSRWLTEPSSPPRLEAEALLRSMFAEYGTKSDLLRTLEQLADQAKEAHTQLLRQAADYLATGGPYPARLHLIALNGRFLLAFTQLLNDWALEAAAEVATWTDTGPLPATTDHIAVFRRVLGDSLFRQIEHASRADRGDRAEPSRRRQTS